MKLDVRFFSQKPSVLKAFPFPKELVVFSFLTVNTLWLTIFPCSIWLPGPLTVNWKLSPSGSPWLVKLWVFLLLSLALWFIHSPVLLSVSYLYSNNFIMCFCCHKSSWTDKAQSKWIKTGPHGNWTLKCLTYWVLFSGHSLALGGRDTHFVHLYFIYRVRTMPGTEQTLHRNLITNVTHYVFNTWSDNATDLTRQSLIDPPSLANENKCKCSLWWTGS